MILGYSIHFRNCCYLFLVTSSLSKLFQNTITRIFPTSIKLPRHLTKTYIPKTSIKLLLHLTKTYLTNIHPVTSPSHQNNLTNTHQVTSPSHQSISLPHPSIIYIPISPNHISPTSIKLLLHFNRTYLSKIHQVTSPSHQNISLHHPSSYLSISPKHITTSSIKLPLHHTT